MLNAFLALLFSAHAVLAKVEEPLGSLQMPKELKATEIEDKTGNLLPRDITIIDQDGKSLLLGQYFNGVDRRPAILILAYYGCPMLCTVIANGVVKGLKEIKAVAGKDYRIITASVDHRETPDLAKKKQESYLDALGITDPNAWTFHVMSESQAKRLGDAVGFHYMYDKKTDQIAHGAGIFFISPDGVLTRTLLGIEFEPRLLELSLGEAKSGTLGSFINRVILSCFHYNPDSSRYGIYILGVMRLGGILTILILGTMLIFYFRSERKGIKPVV